MGAPPRNARTAPLRDEAYTSFVQLLVEKRLQSGLTQQAVADALGWNQSMVAKAETAQRRLDIVEFVRMATTIGFDAAQLVKDLQRQMHARS